jgi:serine/threonine protein kinase
MSGLDVDTRTDVYSLDAILYELLTGTMPFESKTLREMGLDEIRRTLREVDPPKPSTRVVATALKGDLDWITMKALEKDRTATARRRIWRRTSAGISTINPYSPAHRARCTASESSCAATAAAWRRRRPSPSCSWALA